MMKHEAGSKKHEARGRKQEAGAWLAAAVATVPADGSTAVDFTWLFVKMAIFLGIVIVLALMFLKYVAPRLRQGMSGYFQILGRHKLEGRKSLYLIRALERYLVIGVSENGMTKIAEVTKEEIEGEKEAGSRKQEA